MKMDNPVPAQGARLTAGRTASTGLWRSGAGSAEAIEVAPGPPPEHND